MTNLREQLQAGLSGSYVIERELGRGGMATVYLARDVKHDRPVALKVDRPPVMVGSALDAHRLRVLVPCSTTPRRRRADRPGE